MQNPPKTSGGRSVPLHYDAKIALQIWLGYLLRLDEAAHRVARLSAGSEPILHSICVQLDFRRLLQRVIGPDRFHHAPVARFAAFNHHHAIERLLSLSEARQTNR